MRERGRGRERLLDTRKIFLDHFGIPHFCETEFPVQNCSMWERRKKGEGEVGVREGGGGAGGGGEGEVQLLTVMEEEEATRERQLVT